MQKTLYGIHRFTLERLRTERMWIVLSLHIISVRIFLHQLMFVSEWWLVMVGDGWQIMVDTSLAWLTGYWDVTWPPPPPVSWRLGCMMEPDNTMIILIEILHCGLPGLITVLSATGKLGDCETDDGNNISPSHFISDLYQLFHLFSI